MLAAQSSVQPPKLAKLAKRACVDGFAAASARPGRLQQGRQRGPGERLGEPRQLAVSAGVGCKTTHPYDPGRAAMRVGMVGQRPDVQRAGHQHVSQQQHGAWGLVADLQRPRAVLGLNHRKAQVQQQPAHGLAHSRFIIGQQGQALGGTARIGTGFGHARPVAVRLGRTAGGHPVRDAWW